MNTSPPKAVPRLRVLTIADVYPRPLQPQVGIFAEQQTQALAAYCDPVVVAPLRVTPPLSVLRKLGSPAAFKVAWQAWRSDIGASPLEQMFNGIKVYRPRFYSAPPRHPFHGIWGFFAYIEVLPLLRRLHAGEPFDLIHAHNASPGGLIGKLAQRWMRVPLAISMHGLDFTDSIPRSSIGRRAIESVYRSADLILANGTWTARKAVEHGANPDRTRVVYLGGNADMPATLPHERVQSPTNQVRLLTVARLVELKGIQWVLRAVRQLVDEGWNILYTIVGRDDGYGDALHTLAADLNLGDNVRFTGTISREEIWSHYTTADLFVMPSYPETFGIVYIEALSQGIPVIGCNDAGAADIKALDAEGVELVPPENPDAVAEAIRNLINDPVRRENVRQKSPQIIKQRFTWERTAREIYALYSELLDARKSHREAGVLQSQ